MKRFFKWLKLWLQFKRQQHFTGCGKCKSCKWRERCKENYELDKEYFSKRNACNFKYVCKGEFCEHEKIF